MAGELTFDQTQVTPAQLPSVQEEIPGPPSRDSTGRSQCHVKGRRLKEAAGREDREGREQSPNTDEHLFTVSSTMEIIFGRNKKEQLEPVRARVTGERFV